ncbi:MAG TPA: tetratricopeptide repeat protein [Candidatus Obscuribacterales bacterium]
MIENSTNALLERLVQQHGQSLEELTRHQQEMFAQLNERHNELVAQVRSQQTTGKKDIWDRMAALAPMLSAAIIALTGAYFTYSYNQQQLKVQEIQTIERFLPHLVGDEKSKRAAILAMSSLGNAKLAAKVASIFASEGTASALTSIAKSSPSEDKEMVSDALYKTLDALAEKYRYENRYEEAVDTYKRAVAIKESVLGKDSPEIAEDIDKLADLYEAHGDKEAANAVRARTGGNVAAAHQSTNGGTAHRAAQAANTEESLEPAGAPIPGAAEAAGRRSNDAFASAPKAEAASGSDL